MKKPADAGFFMYLLLYVRSAVYLEAGVAVNRSIFALLFKF